MCDTTNCTKAIDVAPPTVIHSFGSDNSDHLYVIGPGGLWRLVSPQLCDQTPPPSAPPSPLPIQVPVPAPVAQPQPAPIVPARSVFKNPKMYCPDENGNLEISLTVKTQTWKTNVFEFQTRSYDGEFPGPSIIVAPGTPPFSLLPASSLLLMSTNMTSSRNTGQVVISPSYRSTAQDHFVVRCFFSLRLCSQLYASLLGHMAGIFYFFFFFLQILFLNGSFIGSMLKIKIINQLEPTVYDAATSHNDQHPEINATNLHLHGLHVSPSGKGDNVLGTNLPIRTKDSSHVWRLVPCRGQLSSSFLEAILPLTYQLSKNFFSSHFLVFIF
jgi:hypothetical protein